MSCCVCLENVAANDFTPPLQLHRCVPDTPSQLWSFGTNGSIYSLDMARSIGYCLESSGNMSGAQVMAANCGPPSRGVDPTGGARQLWAVNHNTIVSLLPGTPLCFGVQPDKNGIWNSTSVDQRGQLGNCSSATSHFVFSNSTDLRFRAHKFEEQPVAPTTCKVEASDVVCYKTKGGGPCGPGCPGPMALPIKAPTPNGLQMTWELCAHLCYNLNQTKAGIEYGGQCSCGNVVDTSGGNNKTSTGCDMDCGHQQACGGSYHIDIFPVHCTGPKIPPLHPPPPPPPGPPPPPPPLPPPPSPPPPPCVTFTSKAACPTLRCQWTGNACVPAPLPSTGNIVHEASGLCLTIGRCASPPPPAPPDPKAHGRLPCDIYGSAGHPCVAAHSTVRALFSDYSGPLYCVLRATDNASINISVGQPGGVADTATQDSFCKDADCVVTEIFDQSPNRNHLPRFNYSTPQRVRVNKGVNATADPHTLSGHVRIILSLSWARLIKMVT